MNCAWMIHPSPSSSAYTTDDLEEWGAFYEQHRCPNMCERTDTGLCEQHMKYWPTNQPPKLMRMFQSLISDGTDSGENLKIFLQNFVPHCTGDDCTNLFQSCILLMFSPAGLYTIRPSAFAMMMATVLYLYMQEEANPGEPITQENAFKDLADDFNYDALVDVVTAALERIQLTFSSDTETDRMERMALYQMFRFRWSDAFSVPKSIPKFAHDWQKSWMLQLQYPPVMRFEDEFKYVFTKLSIHMMIYSERDQHLNPSKLREIYFQVQNDVEFKHFMKVDALAPMETLDTFRSQTPMIERLEDMETDQVQSTNTADSAINLMNISAARAYASRKQKENPSTGCHVM